MKKKFLALLLGGVVAVGGLFMQMSVTAEAITQEECKFLTESHIKSYALATIDGQLTVTIDFESEATNARLMLCAFEKELEKVKEEYDLYPNYHSLDEWVNEGYHTESKLDITNSGTYTFTGLTAGKTYYIYATLIDIHDQEPGEDSGQHFDMYLGSKGLAGCAVNNIDVETDSAATYEENLTSQIMEAQPGATIVMEQGVTTLPNSVMKELLKRKDVSLKLEFTYQDKEYVIIIPAGAALDNDIPYYGPLYLAQHFGNRAGTNTSAASGTGNTYEIQSGDCLNKIAAANNMTLKQLLEKNPQIKDPNKIIVGQKINW